MNCRKVNNLLSAYMDGELPGVEQLQIRDHLQHCDSCQEEHDTLLMTKRMLAGLAVKQPGEELESRILRATATERQVPLFRTDLRDLWLLMEPAQRLRAGALCATGVAALLFLVLGPARIAAPDAVAALKPSSSPAPEIRWEPLGNEPLKPAMSVQAMREMMLHHDPAAYAPPVVGSAPSPATVSNASLGPIGR